MRPGEPRYVAKAIQRPRSVRWGVYDRQEASWPVQRPDLGKVKQEMRTEAEAQTEADRLNDLE